MNRTYQLATYFAFASHDIKDKVKSITGNGNTFKMTALTEEYHESKKLREEAITNCYAVDQKGES